MEFQAVILCGPGKHLHPVTTGIPKALLPVANKPLVSHALDFCKRAQFATTTIACCETEIEEVKNSLAAQGYQHLRYVGLPEGAPSGSVITLLDRAKQINPQLDIVVVPCDFFSTVDPELLISQVRSQDDSAIITGFYYQNKVEALDSKTLTSQVFLHSVGGDDELLLDSYEREAIQISKAMKVRMAMLWQFSHVVASMDLLQSGIFFLSRKILELPEDAVDVNRELAKVVRNIARRTWRHRKQQDTVVLKRLSDAEFLRANNLPAYIEANRRLLRAHARQKAMEGEQARREPGQAVIGHDSMVGVNTSVGERSSVKRTAIGANCTVGKKCRLNGCVILDGVQIANDVTLENTIIGKNAVVESKVKLVGCSVEGGYTVVTETDAKNEVLKGLSMEGIDDDEFGDMYESISDEEEDEDDEDDEDEEDEDDDDDDEEDDLFER